MIVIVKNAPGHCDESLMASITVRMNITTSTNMLPTIRVVKLSLKENKGWNCSSQNTEMTKDILTNLPFTYLTI